MLYIVSNKIPTGGPETLHQFAKYLKSLGVEVEMFYCDSASAEVPEKLKKYKVPIAKKIVDSNENMMIVPETFTRYLYQYEKIRKCIWWLSRDFYYGYLSLEGLVRCAQRQRISKFLFPICIPLIYIRHKITRPYFKFGKDKNEIFHLYNCEYAREYLVQHGVKEENTLYMCGPIRKEYFIQQPQNKELLVTYNPKKNFPFTKKIIKVLSKKRPDIEVIGISGMKPNEIVDLLARCSVYIDFGHFPGPERIPREAVTCYCNVITSKYGSAGNEIDVLVPDKYKFEASTRNLNKIVDTIEELVDNYKLHVREYDEYREKVRKQIEYFEEHSRKFVNLFDL